MRDQVEMLDGRVYLTHDNWETVFIKRGGRVRLVTGAEADTARFIAIAQSSASADDNRRAP